MSPILDQSPDTNTGTTTEVRTATADTSEHDMGPSAHPDPDGYHARIYDLSVPYRGASRVIVSRLGSGDTIVAGPVAPGEYEVTTDKFINPLTWLGNTESLVDALARMGYTAA